MKRKGYSAGQIVAAARQLEQRTPAADIAHKLGLPPSQVALHLSLNVASLGIIIL